MNMPCKIRRIAERASRGITLRRRLPKAFGGATIFVTPESMLRFWRFNLESVDPPLLASVRSLVKPGDVVWDVGANVGLFSMAASWVSGASGQVYAFEPDIWLANMIKSSVRKLSDEYAPVKVVPVGISDHPDVARLCLGEAGRATNHVANLTQHDAAKSPNLIPTVTLDWLAERLPPPDMLKIDVEGAETQVLRGATRLLSECHPVILCEVTHNSAAAVSSILRAAGYSLLGYEGTNPVDVALSNIVAFNADN